MCIAIYKPAGKKISWDSFKAAENYNDDGWGFAARTPDGNLVVRRGVDHYDGFRAAFEPFRKMQAIIHFRMRTHGTVKEGNCHPFMVSEGLAMIHNGVIPISCNVSSARSDTWHFNELVLREFYSHNKSFWRRPEYKFLIEQMSGGSKFCFLRRDGAMAIYNESSGHWHDGCWYSNHTYKCSTSRYTRIGYWSGRDEDRYDRWFDDKPDPYGLGGRRQNQPTTTETKSPVVQKELPVVQKELPAAQDDDAKADTLAYQEYVRQQDEALRASQTPVEDEIVVEQAEALAAEEVEEDPDAEAEKVLAEALFLEGLSSGAVEEVYDVFGLLGLQALVEMIPEGLNGQ